MILIIFSDAQLETQRVETVEEAQQCVRDHIARFDLGSGCSTNTDDLYFHRAILLEDRPLGEISYNGTFTKGWQ